MPALVGVQKLFCPVGLGFQLTTYFLFTGGV
jgi:hypothetical protein